MNYAAADAVVCHRAARAMWRQLSRQERRCFEVQNAAIPAIARMRLTGCPFAAEIHRETIRRWEIEHAEERARFKEITGEEPPPATRPALGSRRTLPAEEIAWMPRTEHRHGLGPLRSAEAPGAPRGDQAAAPGAVLGQAPAQLRPQADRVDQPGDRACSSRLHARHEDRKARVLGAEFQQPPPDVRPAIMAPDGKLLVVAD